jgi:hypothetical protein
MFEGAERKLSLAEYFLNNLRALAKEAGGFAHIRVNKKHEVIANLDGFLFELISAKDFFISGIIDLYKPQLPQNIKITQKKRLIEELKARQLDEAAGVMEIIDQLLDRSRLNTEQKLQDDEKSWLWRLNNYRNSATHRELVHFWHVSNGPTIELREGEEPQFQIILDPKTKAPRYLRRIDVPSDVYEFKDLGTYLYKDPEDPSQGNAEVEVIPYCEQSLDKVRRLLENLYSQLEIKVK